MTDPVTYSVHISHWNDGQIDVMVESVGSSIEDRESIIYALATAIDIIRDGEIGSMQ